MSVKAVRREQFRPLGVDGRAAWSKRACASSNVQWAAGTRIRRFTKNVEKNLNTLDPALGTLIEDLKRARPVEAYDGDLHRRIRPHAEDQRQRRPRSLPALLLKLHRRRRNQRRFCLRQQQRDWGRTERQPDDDRRSATRRSSKRWAWITPRENQSPQGRPIRVVDKGKAVKELIA